MTTTQVEQDNIAAVRRGFEAFGARDMSTLTKLFDAGANWHAVPTGILGGDRRGRDDIFSMFALLGAETQGTFRVVPREFAATADNVYVHATATGSRKGRSIESDEVLIFSMSEGVVHDVRLYLHDQPANAAFWQ